VAEKEKLKASHIVDMLRTKYPLPAFALLEQVADGTGARQTRWADAIVMSVWPSRGYHLHGFEVKVSRSDWLHELRQPEKADAMMQYCDGWYLAVSDAAIVQPGELPSTWGLMAAKGGRLVTIVEAPKLTPKDFCPPLVASILRNAVVSDAGKIAKARAEGEAAGREAGRDYTAKRLSELKEQVDAFERSSGIKISEYFGGKELGEAVNTVRSMRWLHLDGALTTARAVVRQLEVLDAVAMIKTLANEIEADNGNH
jgi:hypothetical protein